MNIGELITSEVNKIIGQRSLKKLLGRRRTVEPNKKNTWLLFISGHSVAGVNKVPYSRVKNSGKKINIFQVRKKNQDFWGKITLKTGFFSRFFEILYNFWKKWYKNAIKRKISGIKKFRLGKKLRKFFWGFGKKIRFWKEYSPLNFDT